ncbi:hypothetical protein M427DRAFT_181488 [Gonapodya prolifera JEL478]|uniref:G-protein coupled receptors family 1 profile domain-containing protein n=1 Tax=Gonapodya prolifera (strain JEL478) TaxID=1344416 RepID=A0A139AQK5_GONPJ|nr:hypothetical protein M427DRAFT_181488 [Gonapodya prolifera JEL478]|eukprot:KXS19030.1 hypothetical protein M427DRAFT_181488 [Gonapodya prolifera JEL478]
MAGGIGDDIAIANGFFPRGTRAVWIIPITILTIVGDYSVLLFYLVAYGARLSILRHPLHKMIIMMFVFNFIGAFLLYFVGFVNPESVGCKAGIFIIVGSVTGDYCAAFSICWMLFQSLVLQWRRTNLMETLTLFFPPLTALLYGLLTIGGYVHILPSHPLPFPSYSHHPPSYQIRPHGPRRRMLARQHDLMALPSPLRWLVHIGRVHGGHGHRHRAQPQPPRPGQ